MGQKNYYALLGVSRSATEDEIRKAYRTLARKFHPDSSTSSPEDEAKFKEISEAYRVLKDVARRKRYDQDVNTAFEKFEKRQAETASQHAKSKASARYFEAQRQDIDAIKGLRKKATPKTPEPHQSFTQTLKERLERVSSPLQESVARLVGKGTHKPKGANGNPEKKVSKVSILEVSITVIEAIQGVRKTVSLDADGKSRKIKLRIPPGTRNGHLLRLRSRELPGEELVVLVHITLHPCLSLEAKGLVLKVPVSVTEAILGASLKIPTLSDPVMLKLPAGTQTGTEMRLKGKGLLLDNAEPGDLYVKIEVHIPQVTTALDEQQLSALSEAYTHSVRQHLPASLLDLKN